MQQTQREYEKAIDYLRKLIADGTLTLGSRIPTERAIADALGISRNSTREALRTMENMGVIESKRGSGNYLVGAMGKKMADMLDMMLLLQKTTPSDICQFRRSMEKTIGTLLIDRGDLDLQGAPQVLEAFLTARKEEQVELDQAFHYLLIHATQNQFLITLMEAVTDLYGRFINQVLKSAEESKIEALHASHTAMYEALLRKDVLACNKAIDEHYDIIDAILAL